MPTVEQTIYGNIRLLRHYADGEFPDIACGGLTFWNDIAKQILDNSVSYYWPGDGTNKFAKHIKELNVYSEATAYPDANLGGQVTWYLGNGDSKITCRYLKNNIAYVKSAMSHEFGHCYHNWIRLFEHKSLEDVRRWWDYEITVDKVRFNQNTYPWRQPDGSLQNTWEQFANSYRILFGTVGTRWDLELVPQGMNATTSIPDIVKKLKLLPELCAYLIMVGGCKPETLQWSNGGFLFQQYDNNWVYQTDYYNWQYCSWQWWTNSYSNWTRFYPQYTRD